MNFLNMLMQSLGAGDDEEEFDPNAPINVMGTKNARPESTEPIYGEAPERPVTKQRYVLNDDRMAPTEKELKEIIPRSQGYFGSKGTLRDILGGLSDAFLVQGGADSQYDKLRDRERKGDAMFGFASNPSQAMERLAAAGFTDDAEELQKNTATQDYNNRNLESQNAGRESLSRDRATDNKAAGIRQLGRLANAGAPYSVMRAAARNAGITDEEMVELGVSEGMTEAQRQQLGAADEGVQQQRRYPLEERKVEAQEMNAGSTRINATRPRPGRAPAQPRAKNDEERLESAYSTPPAQRTEYQKNLIERKNKVGRAGGSTRRQINAPATKFEGWTSKPKP